MDQKSFTVQMMKFFGRLPGQTVRDFGSELNALSYEEKLEFVEMLNDVGYPTESPAPPSQVTNA